jgi:hypothetical protein
MKKIYAFFVLSFLSLNLISQKWVDKMLEPGANFYDVQKAANKDFRERIQEEQKKAARSKIVGQEEEKESGYEIYKRLEYFMEPRVYPSGDMTLPSQNWQNFEEFLKNNQSQKTINPNLIASTTWTPMGPMGPISGVVSGQQLKSGRINFITIHPAGSNTLFIGAPAGGLWKSINGGVSWTTTTDFLQVIGCSDLVIDPSNTNIMYLATGDGDNGDNKSIGVLKSIDGGLTWNTTGLSWAVNLGYKIRKMLIHPTNPQIVVAGASNGIWRTTNGGTTWTQVNTVGIYDLEFKPSHPNTIYAAAGTTFSTSIDGGATWAATGSGISTTGIFRMAIAVTPADSNYVYVLAGDVSNSGFYGFYRSINGAATFSAMATTTPNLMGWSNLGTDVGGQAWYDIAIAASPLNKDEVVTGGVNVWRTTDGGSTWGIYGHWTGTGAPFTHCDQHDLEYDPAGTLFDTNDGTVYKRTGATWTEISGTINISEIYRIGLSGTTANYWITGHQDNGTSRWDGTTYLARLYGDGMDCWIDRTNNSNMYASNSSVLRYSTNGGSSWTPCGGLSGSGAWVTPWHQDPQVATNCWAGLTQLFHSTNSGANFAMTTGTMSGGTITEFAVAPSNNQIVYVTKGTSLFQTTNGGATWTNITGTIPTAGSKMTYITVSPTNANTLWVTLSGYSAGNKIFMSTNGGSTWTNYTSNLPNLPADCSVYQPGSNDMIYVGMDVGVYYRDNTMGTWTLYNNGLPNMGIADMEISPADPTKLYAATFGRGVWKVDLVTALPPTSNFSVAATTLCSGQNISFTDGSSNIPTSWSWSVSPSAGVTVTTPTLQNPSMNFGSGGSYVVTLVASNGSGPGSPISQTITINPTPTVAASASNTLICLNNSVMLMSSGASTYTWNPGNVTGSMVSFTPAVSTIYTVTGTSGAGCVSGSAISVSVSACTGINSIVKGENYFVYPNPTNGILIINSTKNISEQVIIEIVDESGKVVLKQNLVFNTTDKSQSINTSGMATGIYFVKVISKEGKPELIKIVKE